MWEVERQSYQRLLGSKHQLHPQYSLASGLPRFLQHLQRASRASGHTSGSEKSFLRIRRSGEKTASLFLLCLKGVHPHCWFSPLGTREGLSSAQTGPTPPEGSGQRVEACVSIAEAHDLTWSLYFGFMSRVSALFHLSAQPPGCLPLHESRPLVSL